MFHPDYPLVSGLQCLGDDWTLCLPYEFNFRLDEESYVFWRPGLSIWLMSIVFETKKETLMRNLKKKISEHSYDIREFKRENVIQLVYKLDELEEDVRKASVYSLIASDLGYLQVGSYCEQSGDMEVLDKILFSICKGESSKYPRMRRVN